MNIKKIVEKALSEAHRMALKFIEEKGLTEEFKQYLITESKKEKEEENEE